MCQSQVYIVPSISSLSAVEKDAFLRIGLHSNKRGSEIVKTKFYVEMMKVRKLYVPLLLFKNNYLRCLSLLKNDVKDVDIQKEVAKLLGNPKNFQSFGMHKHLGCVPQPLWEILEMILQTIKPDGNIILNNIIIKITFYSYDIFL